MKSNMAARIQNLEEELFKTIKERDRVLKEYEILNEVLKQKTLSCLEATIGAHVRKLENALSR